MYHASQMYGNHFATNTTHVTLQAGSEMGSYCIGEWVGFAAGLNAVQKRTRLCRECNPNFAVFHPTA
jgi:hypothetical protein